MSEPNESVVVDSLRSIPMFADLSDASIDRIHQLSSEWDATPGQVLVQPRTEGSGLFIIESGTVEVEHRGRHTELSTGQCFGELALLTPRTRTARVRAKTKARLLTINRYDFRRLLEAEPKIAISMLEMMADRFAATLD